MVSSIIADDEQLRLIKAFPSFLRQDVEEVINIIPFNRHVRLADGHFHHVSSLINPAEQIVLLDGESLNIPGRIYFNEPDIDKEESLTALQISVLNCIYLRHHNGFVRQKRLEQLIDTNHYFIVPYTFQLLGEYVMEILKVLDQHINQTTIDNYAKFINENTKYWHQTESRMISYWNEYYRRSEFPQLRHYIGKQIIDRIKVHRQHNISPK